MLVLLKLTLVLALGCLFTLIRQWSAAQRFLLGFTALLAAPLVGITDQLLRELRPLGLPPLELDLPLLTQVSVELNRFQAEVVATAHHGIELPVMDTSALLWALYLGVFVLLALRLVWQLYAAHRWVATAREVDQFELAGRSIPIVTLGAAGSPFAWGLRHPIVAVPSQWTAWPRARQRMVLLHEGAHIQRHDLLWFVLLQVLCGLLWFHPLAWYLRSRLRNQAEQACDDYVLRAGVSGAEYAEQLIKMTRLVRPQVVPAMASKSKLSARVMALVDTRVRRLPMKLKHRCISVVLLCAVLAPVGSLSGTPVTDVSPKVLDELKTIRQALKNYHFQAGEDQVRELLNQERLSPAELGQAYNLLGYAHYLQTELDPAIQAFEQVLGLQQSVPAETLSLNVVRTLPTVLCAGGL